MKQKTIFKSMLSVILVSAIVMLGAVISKGNAVASDITTDTCTVAWELYSAETENKYVDYRSNGYTAPTKTDFVFAGWYDAENGTPLTETEADAATQAYAKFVPAHILTVKAQITEAWTYGQTEADNAKLSIPVTAAAIRLVTTVDSLKYQNVGFTMTIGEVEYDSIAINEANGNDTKNIVYSSLYAVGEQGGTPISYYPSSFCSMSKYFKTFTFTGIPVSDFNDYISAKAYWTTVDGTKVSGAESVKTVNLGRANGKATTTDGTFVNPFEALREDTVGENALLPYTLFYENFEDALKGTASEKKATVQLIKDIDIDAQITINAELVSEEAAELGDAACTDITITNCITELPVKNAADEVTITKAITTSGANMFNVANGYSLTIEGANTETKTGITVNGNEKDTKASLIVNAGTFAVKNTTVKNAIATDNSGGAIANSGTLNIDNADFTNNKVVKASNSTQGGAINITGGTVIITNTKFEENSATKDGGAIRNGSATAIKIANCEFVSNTTGKAGKLVKNSNDDIIGGAGENSQGGAIYMTGSASFTIDSSNNVFTDNSAPKGGAICYNSSETSEVKSWSFDNNSAYAYITLTDSGNTDTDGNKIYTSSTAEGHAGAIYVNKGTFELTNAEFTGNSAIRQGGAIRVSDNNDNPVLKATDCKFIKNTSKTDGGAIRCGEILEINDCTFDSNVSHTKGGAIYLTASSGVIQNSTGNTFVGNEVTGTDTNGYGGALYVADGTCMVSGWTFEDNSATTIGDDIAVASGKSITLSDSTFDNGVVALRTSSATTAVANISGKLEDVTFVYHGYDGSSTLATGVTVSEAGIDTASDIKLIPHVSTLETTVLFGSVSSLSDEQRARFGATSAGDGKHFGITAEGKLEYVKVAKNETTSTEYDTLAGAISAASSGDTITVLRDSEINSRINIGENSSVTLTLQPASDRSVTISKANGSLSSSNIIKVCTDADVTIQSNNGNNIIFDGRCDKEAAGVDTSVSTTAALMLIDGKLTLNDVIVQKAKSTGNGGAIQVRNSGVLTATDCLFDSNAAGTTGGVYVNTTATVAFNKCDFIANTCTNATSGGAIYQNSATTVNITESNFYNNSASQGGAIEQYKGTMNITDSYFEGNSCNSNGGAIRTEQTAVLNITDSSFVSNHASKTSNGNGGAIYVTGSATAIVNVTDEGTSRFEENTASRTTTSNETTVLNAKTFGAIARGSASATVEYSGNCTFADNTDGSVTESGATEFATGVGVGDAADYTTKALLKVFEAVTYADLKNAVANNAVGHPTEIRLTTNIAMEDRIDCSGKDIILTNKDNDVEIAWAENATATNMFKSANDGTLTIQGANAESRTGITLNGASKSCPVLVYSTEGNVVMKNATLMNANSTGDGGAISQRVSGTLTVENCLFTSNIAKNYGAAIHVTTADDVTITNCDFGEKVTSDETVTYQNGNKASHGGAIYISGTAGEVTITNSNFYGNESDSKNVTAYGGGAICQIGGTLTITGSGEFAGNKATGNQGGAVYASGVSSVDGYLFTANEAKSGGGALRIQNTCTVKNCVFNNNVSSTHGGAIYVASGQVKGNLILDEGVTFTGNTSSQYATAISINSAANWMGLSNCTFGDNQTVKNHNADTVITEDNPLTTE